MKILFPISIFYPSQNGGPANTVYWHTCALKEKGIDNTIITTSRGIPYKQDFIYDKFIDRECGKIYYSSASTLRFKSIRTIFKEVSSHDIIHLNSLFSLFSIFTFFVLRFTTSQNLIVWSTRGELSSFALSISQGRKNFLLKIYKKLATDVIFHSTSNEETSAIKNYFPDNKVIQIPNLMILANRLSLDKERIIMFLGRIHPIKNLENLIIGFGLWSTKFNVNYKLLIYGKAFEGEELYFSKLKNLITELELEDRVIFKGMIYGITKEEALSKARVLVLPSKSENFGNVVIEALNQGTPVIASNSTPWKILEEYNAGFHISVSPESIAYYLDKISKMEKQEYTTMQSNCYKLVDVKFDARTQIDQWVKLYKNRCSQ